MGSSAYSCCANSSIINSFWRLAGAAGRVSARRPSDFLLLRQKKVAKEKATLLPATLRFAAGNLWCSLRAGTRSTRFAQTDASPDPLAAVLLGADRRGLAGTDNQQPRARQPEGESRSGLRRVLLDCWSPGWQVPEFLHPPLVWRRGAQASAGCRACAVGEDCLSLAEASSAAACRCRAPQRSPRSGPPQQGRLFFAFVSFGEAKEMKSPAGATPGQHYREKNSSSNQTPNQRTATARDRASAFEVASISAPPR
jgi:hypothetical protein